jgi:hypothetical protein
MFMLLSTRYEHAFADRHQHQTQAWARSSATKVVCSDDRPARPPHPISSASKATATGSTTKTSALAPQPRGYPQPLSPSARLDDARADRCHRTKDLRAVGDFSKSDRLAPNSGPIRCLALRGISLLLACLPTRLSPKRSDVRRSRRTSAVGEAEPGTYSLTLVFRSETQMRNEFPNPASVGRAALGPTTSRASRRAARGRHHGLRPSVPTPAPTQGQERHSS